MFDMMDPTMTPEMLRSAMMRARLMNGRQGMMAGMGGAADTSGLLAAYDRLGPAAGKDGRAMMGDATMMRGGDSFASPQNAGRMGADTAALRAAWERRMARRGAAGKDGQGAVPWASLR